MPTSMPMTMPIAVNNQKRLTNLDNYNAEITSSNTAEHQH